MDTVGNIAMPIYTYRQVGGRSRELLLWVAVASEPGYWLMTGGPGNVVWLFLGAALCRAEVLRDALLGGFLLGVMVWLHPGWVVWLPLLWVRDRAWWYSIHGALGLWVDWRWLVHLVGYEIARAPALRWFSPPRWLWVGAYPVHMLLIGVAKKFWSG